MEYIESIDFVPRKYFFAEFHAPSRPRGAAAIEKKLSDAS
jgi:hypothetical protein